MRRKEANRKDYYPLGEELKKKKHNMTNIFNEILSII